jgi:hypothetical protein
MKPWRHRIFAILILLSSITASILLISPVFASIPQPDSSPTINFTHVNRNLILTGDVAVTGEYNIPYASLPAVNADQAFYIRLIDLDGTTEIGSVTPYVYFNSGYGHGAFMLYFATGFTWGTNYTIRVSENPSQFALPVNYDFVINAADFFTGSDTTDAQQADLGSQVLKIAADLQTHYPSYTFSQTIPGRTVLASPTGETYFSNAMPGLQTMCPDIFLIQLEYPDVTSTNWTTAQADTYAGRFSANFVGTATNATATQFHMTPMMITGLIFTMPVCAGAIVVSSRKYQRAEAGFIVCLIAIILSFIMGWVPAAIFASLYQCLGIYVAYLWFYARG